MIEPIAGMVDGCKGSIIIKNENTAGAMLDMYLKWNSGAYISAALSGLVTFIAEAEDLAKNSEWVPIWR